ncbi:MAG: hypothetical protein LBG58_08825 [Planctomycetaceae bacterium]|nr:hypothetical protein [Planctomycetaceae bacterium]
MWEFQREFWRRSGTHLTFSVYQERRTLLLYPVADNVFVESHRYCQKSPFVYTETSLPCPCL